MSDEQTQDPQTAASEPAVETTPEVIAETPVETTPEVVTEVAPEAAPVEEAPVVAAAPEVAAKPEPAFKAKLVNLHELKPGQTIRVHERIVDVSPKGETRERIQVFEGIILGLSGAGIGRTMTVRKVSDGVSVEKIYPINSPVVAKIELTKVAKVRRAKLRFLLDVKDRFKRKLKETYLSDKKK